MYANIFEQWTRGWSMQHYIYRYTIQGDSPSIPILIFSFNKFWFSEFSSTHTILRFLYQLKNVLYFCGDTDYFFFKYSVDEDYIPFFL